MKLVEIPKDKYSDYRYNVIFRAYKWDPQVGDHNTVSKHVLVITKEEEQIIKDLSEKLAKETMEMESALLKNIKLAKKLGLPKQIIKNISKIEDYNGESHIRLMRFDFHPTINGFNISEVNSDVPGGLAEASILPRIAKEYLNDFNLTIDFRENMLKEIKEKVPKSKNVGFVYATSYSDDRQVMQFLGDELEKNSYKSIYLGPDLVRFKDKEAYSILNDNNCKLDCIMRFFPLEWMLFLDRKVKSKEYYYTKTTSCNHPLAILTQSKRLPLIWDKLNVSIPTWKMLLPNTIDAKIKNIDDNKWIYKPVLGRVGGGITIKEAITEKELKNIKKAVKKSPKDWILQEKFESIPLEINNEKFHLCLGVFTINGKYSGLYGRISGFARIDERAIDIPVLIGGN